MRVLAIPLLTFALAGCHAPRVAGSDRNVIRAEEIATIEATTALEVVTRLRAEYLRSRGPASASRGRAVERPTVTVFVDGVEAGPPDPALRLIPAANVVEIRMYRAADATTKYGSRHTGGVLEVKTRSPVRP